MRCEVSQLPESFPVGTRYVIEGRGGRIRLRYLEFPDGRHVDLPADMATRTARSRIRPRNRRDRRRAGAKKI